MKCLSVLIPLIWLASSYAFCADGFTMTDAVQATFKLFNEGSTATGFVIRVKPAAGDKKAEYVIATAAHTFEKMKGDGCLLVLRTPKNDGSYNRKDVSVAIRKDSKNLWTKHKDADIAVLEYEPTAEFEKFAVPLELLATEEDFKTRVPAGTYVRLLCYPEQFEANSAGFPILRHGVLATYPFAPTNTYKTFMIDYTTFAGDSGGPVFGALDGPGGPLKLFGVVVSRQWSDERIKLSEREDRVIRHPFGLGSAVNAQLLRDLIAKDEKK
jgi:hypothetical protein